MFDSVIQLIAEATSELFVDELITWKLIYFLDKYLKNKLILLSSFIYQLIIPKFGVLACISHHFKSLRAVTKTNSHYEIFFNYWIYSLALNARRKKS